MYSCNACVISRSPEFSPFASFEHHFFCRILLGSCLFNFFEQGKIFRIWFFLICFACKGIKDLDWMPLDSLNSFTASRVKYRLNTLYKIGFICPHSAMRTCNRSVLCFYTRCRNQIIKKHLLPTMRTNYRLAPDRVTDRPFLHTGVYGFIRTNRITISAGASGLLLSFCSAAVSGIMSQKASFIKTFCHKLPDFT